MYIDAGLSQEQKEKRDEAMDPWFEHYCSQNEPHEFLQMIGDNVPLTKLYRMLDTCAHNSENKYCPIMFEITDTQLQTYYGVSHLLQVWSSDKQMLVYQKGLQNPVKNWFIQNDFFVY